MKQQRGFTMVEAMVVVAIIAVLAAVAAPALQDLVTNQRVKSQASELFADILRARSEAIKRNTEVSLSPTTNWSTGWSIPSPVAGNSALVVHSTNPKVTIDGPNAAVVFTSAGRVKGASNPSFTVKASNGTARCITVDLSGRPNVQNKTC